MIFGCSTTSKSSKKQENIPVIPHENTETHKDDEFEIKRMVPTEDNEFEIKNMESTECWMNTDPKNCPEFQNDNNQSIYIKSKIPTEKESDQPTEDQYERLQKQISFQYFQLLNNKIADELFTKYSQCMEKEDLCKEKFNEYKSSQEKIRNKFEIIDHHWNQMNGQWELNVLVAISHVDFYSDKKKIIEDKILSRLPQEIKIYNDPPMIYID